MQETMISVKQVCNLIQLNDVINEPQYKELTVKMGPDKDYLLDVKSMLSLISIFSHEMYMIIDGDKTEINSFIDEIESIDGVNVYMDL